MQYPDTNILQTVRAGFIGRGTTLAEWCRAHDVDTSWAWRVLRGAHNGPKAKALRVRIARAAGAI